MAKFTRATSGNPKGRPKGRQNRVTVEARELCLQLLNDPAYRAKFLADWRRRKVLPAIESMVWFYGHGKPTDRVEHSGPDGTPIEPSIMRVIFGGRHRPDGAVLDEGQV